jgi:uncharacterized DUF497 family protein
MVEKRARLKSVAAGIYDGVYSHPEMQQGDEFEWDSHNEDRLAARHGVDRYEAEEAAIDTGAFIKRSGTDRVGNPEYIFVGKTDDGRILFMVGVRKRGRIWRIGSARDAQFQEKRAYRRRNK